ncbi:SigE family RNA polymerase sigma factor [Streptomyces beihaiensis]|uniref:SigE family RNA polymerase sigma factor n=1 Tax=Streptomyces beihaiensis TaxID=2984495 RepID=A0ABT3TY62_9ACTN|nr:SigE family RNA polymerase sigma factor [Streptomyces beihaiensis]MCX3061976.1 SigE family RNA polymerase sigma factor [Streptomyces beihaiensis]
MAERPATGQRFEAHEDFGEYVRLRRDALLRIALRIVPDPADAEDLLQAALLRTQATWPGIKDMARADGYIRRVMINLRTEWWRARKVDEVPLEHLPDAGFEEVRPRQLLDQEELLEVLPLLGERQRTVVVLRYWEDFSTKETAQALGISPGTVKSTLHRALEALRRELTTARPAA